VVAKAPERFPQGDVLVRPWCFDWDWHVRLGLFILPGTEGPHLNDGLSLGASAVLVYGVITSAFAQPRNVMGGHVISALIGVASYKLLGGDVWLAATIAVSLSVMAMLLTRTVHPPGGATALTAVIGGNKVYDLGFFYVLVPVALGVLILLAVGLIVNNVSSKRRYPEYWF